MRRPVLAMIATLVAVVAITIVLVLGRPGTPEHHHEAVAATQQPDSVAAPAVSSGQSATIDPSATGPSAAAPSPDPVVELSGSTAGRSPDSATPGAAAGAAPAAVLTPVGDPAGQRQISLDEAAAAAPPTETTVAQVRPVSATGWIDPEAAGVNDGTKKQAADVQLQAAPTVAPTEVLPSNGQVSGCVTGYGRGAVCLPQTPPSHAGHGQLTGEDLSQYWTCAEVRELLPNGVIVDSPTSDVLGLDTNTDGTACGPGDS